MNLQGLTSILLLVLAVADTALKPPVAQKKPKLTEIHGDRLVDEYFWLRDKSNPDVAAYLEAENTYTDGVMKSTVSFQEALYQEMLGRIKQTDMSVPSRLKGFLYYSRTEEGKQYPVFCRKADASGAAAHGRPGERGNDETGHGDDVEDR